MVNINIPLPDSCSSCPLSVRHFGKLYCPALNDRVGNEGKDSRCPLVDAESRGDLISRQALLRQIDIDADGEPGYYGDTWKFIDTIKHMPTAQPEVETQMSLADCISRQQAIDALGGNEPVGDPSKMDDDDVVKMWERIRIINIINKLPSAQPERKKGEWISNDIDPEAWNFCSVCGEQAIDLFDFCPNCGADMRGEQDGFN